MPAVSVILLRDSAVGVLSHAPSHDVRLLEVMANDDDMPECVPTKQSTDDEDLAKNSVSKGSPKEKGNTNSKIPEKKDNSSTEGTVSPSQSSTGHPQAIPAHFTPVHAGYYADYTAYQYQVTPEPPSPSTGGHMVYDMNSMLLQPTGFAPFPGSFRGPVVPNQNPPSPSQNSIPPASPLFPRVTRTSAGIVDPTRMQDRQGHRGGHSNVQSGRYLSPVYPTMTYPPSVGANGENGSFAESFGGWGDR
jgi:hypothetical protein